MTPLRSTGAQAALGPGLTPPPTGPSAKDRDWRALRRGILYAEYHTGHHRPQPQSSSARSEQQRPAQHCSAGPGSSRPVAAQHDSVRGRPPELPSWSLTNPPLGRCRWVAKKTRAFFHRDANRRATWPVGFFFQRFRRQREFVRNRLDVVILEFTICNSGPSPTHLSPVLPLRCRPCPEPSAFP